MRSLMTYADLLAALQSLTPEELQQPVQSVGPDIFTNEPVELLPGIATGTVGEFEFNGARSSVDNKYHAHEVVLLVDYNQHAEDGAVAYDLTADGEPEDHPIYPEDGPTKREDQLKSNAALEQQ